MESSCRITVGGRRRAAALPSNVCRKSSTAVQGKIPILVDGGFRRGSDIFKALALGAKAICIGRPYLWGLAAFGQMGVDKVLDILTREFELMMRHAGATSWPS
jgi:isopentenyl diphosphate isomerase/L-lactate dehydrogenase-like FMN-dependent dehydrogenase